MKNTFELFAYKGKEQIGYWKVLSIGGGEIKIEGMDGEMYLGVTRESTDNPAFDSNGLPCEAKVLSAHFKICV